MLGHRSCPARLMAAILPLSSLVTPLAVLFNAQVAQAQSRFNDTQGLWNQTCIDNLAQRNIISGYPDGSFRPNASVTRAEYAAMLNKAFPTAPVTRSAVQFGDVPASFWGYNAIQTATKTGFMSGYPGNVFQPNQNIPRAQVLVALSSGLRYSPTGNIDATLNYFYDANTIPSYARPGIAAATERQLVVNYPNVQQLDPNLLASRGDVAAFLCQATRSGNQALIPAQYIAGAAATPQPVASVPAGTRISVRYPDAERIILAPNESVNVALATTSNVTDTNGRIVIPAGSLVTGKIQPAQGGSQFVASGVTVNNQVIPIAATSGIVSTTTNTRDPNVLNVFRNAAIGSAVAAGISGLAGNQTITALKVLTGTTAGAAVETNMGRPAASIARDTLIGAAVATGVSAIVGDRKITPEKVIIGAGAGATIGGAIDPAKETVIVITPNTDLTLTLNSPLSGY